SEAGALSGDAEDVLDREREPVERPRSRGIGFACVLLAQRAELAHRLGAPNQLGEAKPERERPARLEARVARYLVGVRGLPLEHRAGGSTEAFGHVLASVLEVDAAGPGTFSAARLTKLLISANARGQRGGRAVDAPSK